MTQSKEINTYMNQLGSEAKEASLILAQASLEQKNEALSCISEQLETDRDEILSKNKKDLDNENRLENIKELLSAMKEFDNLESFLDHVSLATSIDQEWEGEKVNMMTMHAAKGLEFDVIFLPGW